MISIVCAMGRNRAIGFRNRLLWRIPDDLKRFKRLTLGHPIVMGRKTFESIGKPLPGRTNIVVSRDPAFAPVGCQVCHSLEAALDAAARSPGGNQEVFIIGGGEVYAQSLPQADRLYLTLVDDTPADADVFFPDYSRFAVQGDPEPHQDGPLSFSFVNLVRRPA